MSALACHCITATPFTGASDSGTLHVYDTTQHKHQPQLDCACFCRTRWLGNYDANVLAAALEQHGLVSQHQHLQDCARNCSYAHSFVESGTVLHRTVHCLTCCKAESSLGCYLQEVKWHDARDTQLTSIDLTHHSISTETRQCVAHTVPPQQQDHQHQQQKQQQQQAHSHDQLEHLTLSEHHTGDPQQAQQAQERQQQQQQQELVGLILNVSGRGWLSSLLGGRHWLAIRWLEGAW